MRKRKRIYGILSLLLAFVLIMGNGELVVLAESLAETVSENQASVSGADAEETVGEENVSVSEEVAADVQTGVVGGDCGAEGDNLKWSLDLDTGVLTISGSGAMQDYGHGLYDAPWFEYSNFLKTLILSEKITEIGDWAFSGCSGLTGDLRLPEGLKKIGYVAFEGCSGFTGDLKLPEGLTEIDRGAFRGCSGFTGELMLPEGMPEVDNFVFADCSGFTGKLRLPKSVARIGYGAFVGCSGFTGNLRLPEELTEIESLAFANFQGIERHNVYLGSQISYIGDGAFCFVDDDELDYIIGSPLDVTMVCPTGSYAESWALQNGFKVKSINETVDGFSCQINANMAGLVVIDRETRKVIPDAIITDGSELYTGTDVIVIPVTGTDKISKQLTISAAGYYDAVRTVQLEKGKIKYVDLVSKENEDVLNILSAQGIYGIDDYDLLSEKFYMAYVPDAFSEADALAGNVTTETVTILIDAVGEISKYELIQDGKVIDSSKERRLEFEVVKRVADKEYLVPVSKELVNGKPVYVRITDMQGNQLEKELGIKISRNYDRTENQTQEGKVKIGKKIKMEVPADIPLIGGGTINVGFDEDVLGPLEISIEESGKVRVAFNKSPDMSLKVFEKEYKELSKRVDRNSKKIMNQMSGAAQKFGAGFIDVDGKICGYGEGNLSELETGSFTIKMGILAEIEGKGGYKQYFFVGFVPVNIFVEGSVSCKTGLEAGLVFENSKIKKLDLTGGSLNIKVKLTGGGGVGAGLEVNASVSGSFNYLTKPARNYDKAWLEASGKVSVSLGWFEKDLWKSRSYTKVLHESGVDKKNASGSVSLQEVTDSVPFKQMTRSYLAYQNQRSAAGLSVGNISGGSQEKQLIKPAVYPSAGARLIKAGDKQYLFWLDDILTRSSNNRAALVYAVSEDGQNWSEPVQLVPETENATPDLGYDLYAEGDKIYILWQDGTRLLSEDEDVLAMAESMGISMAVLNTEDGSVTLAGFLTDQPAYYMHPAVLAHGNDTYACFVENLLESRDVAGNNTQILRYSRNGEAPGKLELPQGYQIVNLDLGWFDGQCYAICEADTDGDLKTDADREILAVSLETGEIRRLTDDTVCDTYPQVSDTGILYWNSGTTILSLQELDGEPQPVTESAALEHPAVFTTVPTPEGLDWILFAASDTEEENALAIYGVRQTAPGEYGSVIRLTGIKGTIVPGLSAVFFDGKLSVSLLEGDFLEDGSLLKDLCIYRTGDKTDLLVEEVSYDEKEVIPGSSLSLQIWVKNQGSTVIQNADVRIGETFTASLTSLALQPGEERELTVEGYTVPDSLSAPQKYSVSVDTDGDADPENNKTELTVGYPDLAVSASIRFFEGHNWIDIMVSNENNFAAGGTLKIHKDTLDGEVIFETALDSVSKEIYAGQTVSLEEYDSQYMNYYVEIVCDTEENNLGNNDTLVYVGYGTGVESLPVEKEPVILTSLLLDVQELTMNAGDTRQLLVSTVPQAELGTGEILWTSANPNVADVDENGIVTAKKPGRTVITASYDNLSAQCSITVHADSLEPITILFETQNSQRLQAVTGIMPGSTAKLPEPMADGDKIFLGWYTMPEGGEQVTEEYIFYCSMTLYAHWREAVAGLWVLDLPDETYTGTAIKPKPVVYDHAVRLTEGKDYTLSYKNNKTPNDASHATKAPTVTIKGKGNYTGSVTATFSILPKNLGDGDIEAENLTVASTGKIQKPVPTITWDGKKLKNKTDFMLEYPDTSDGAYKLPGVYTIKIKAKQGGGYTGECTVILTILPDTAVPVSKLTIAKISAMAYQEGTPAEPPLTVKYKGKKLQQGVDYAVAYENNEQAGTARAVLTGLDGSEYSYVGTRTVTFKITGTPISRAQVTIHTGEEGIEYDGTAKNPELTVTVAAGGQKMQLRENTDYTLEYGENTKAGKGTVLIKGMGGYTGTLKKTFNIRTYNINNDKITIENRAALTAVYEKSGAKPEMHIFFDGKELTAGTDYTVSFQNNKKISGRGGTKVPKVTIKGKGNFTGTLSLPFEITQKPLSPDTPDPIVITAADVTLNSKGNYRTKLTLKDSAGKKLTEKKDYVITGYYLSGESGGELPDQAELSVGTELKVTLEGIGNYTGTAETLYRVTANSLTKVSFKISPQTYTGEEIRFTEEDMNNPQIIRVNAGKGKDLPVYGTDYIITGYSHNVQKGKATVTFQGISDAWGGSKTVTFRITSKKMKWFWDLLY